MTGSFKLGDTGSAFDDLVAHMEGDVDRGLFHDPLAGIDVEAFRHAFRAAGNRSGKGAFVQAKLDAMTQAQRDLVAAGYPNPTRGITEGDLSIGSGDVSIDDSHDDKAISVGLCAWADDEAWLAGQPGKPCPYCNMALIGGDEDACDICHKYHIHQPRKNFQNFLNHVIDDGEDLPPTGPVGLDAWVGDAAKAEPIVPVSRTQHNFKASSIATEEYLRDVFYPRAAADRHRRESPSACATIPCLFEQRQARRPLPVVNGTLAFFDNLPDATPEERRRLGGVKQP